MKVYKDGIYQEINESELTEWKDKGYVEVIVKEVERPTEIKDELTITKPKTSLRVKKGK